MVKHTSQYVCVSLISIYFSLRDKIYGGLAKIICTVWAGSRNTDDNSYEMSKQIRWMTKNSQQDTAKRLYPKWSDIFNGSSEDI